MSKLSLIQLIQQQTSFAGSAVNIIYDWRWYKGQRFEAFNKKLVGWWNESKWGKGWALSPH